MGTLRVAPLGSGRGRALGSVHQSGPLLPAYASSQLRFPAAAEGSPPTSCDALATVACVGASGGLHLVGRLRSAKVGR